jgi:hypothetical protein
VTRQKQTDFALYTWVKASDLTSLNASANVVSGLTLRMNRLWRTPCAKVQWGWALSSTKTNVHAGANCGLTPRRIRQPQISFAKTIWAQVTDLNYKSANVYSCSQQK